MSVRLSVGVSVTPVLKSCRWRIKLPGWACFGDIQFNVMNNFYQDTKIVFQFFPYLRRSEADAAWFNLCQKSHYFDVIFINGACYNCLNCTYDEIISFERLSITVGQGGFNIHPETAVFELYIQSMPSCSNLIENKEIDQALVMRLLIFFYRKNFVKFASERRWPHPNRPCGSARLASQKLKKFNRAKILCGGRLFTRVRTLATKQMPSNNFFW